jgi:hypothetical protein
MAGYSGTPLVKKLGIKEGFNVKIVNPPSDYIQTLGVHLGGGNSNLDFIQFFTKSVKELESKFPTLKMILKKNGILWICWPKKAAKVETDLDENKVMKIGLQNGLVDVKVAAIDETWSGLKFVYRLKDR